MSDRYAWQRDIPGFGDEAQDKLRRAAVLVSRVGGVGGMVALQLAAAGVGRLVIAHAGDLREDDLNRQILMSQAGLGTPRAPMAAARLQDLNPECGVVAVNENVTSDNAASLVSGVDLVVACAPLFSERLAMNAACVSLGKPLIDAAMYECDAQVLTVFPGESACLACLYPEEPPAWQRRFPVLGAVAGMVGCLGALEAVKVLTGFAPPSPGVLHLCDLRGMTFRKVRVRRREGCAVCSP